jgi:two-component system chemotaxis response regulator CheB
MIQEQSRKIEETLWTALRMFEERKNLITQTDVGDSVSVGRTARERAEIANIQIGRIRKMLKTADHSIN